MKNKQIGYDAARVKEAYAARHPDRQVLGLYTNRAKALKMVTAQPGRLVDLSYGFYVVTGALV